MATIIDSFLVTLGLDASGFKRGRDEAEEGLDKLKRGAGATGEAFTGLLGTLTELTSGLLIFHEAMKVKDDLMKFVHETISADATTGRLSSRLKIASEDLNAFQEASKRLGGSAEGVNSSLESFGEKLTKLGTKLRGAKQMTLAFQQIFGPGFQDSMVKGRPAIEVLGMLQTKLSGMDFFKAKAMTQMMGLHDEGLVSLLAQSGEGFADLMSHVKGLGLVTKEEIAASKEYRLASADLAQSQEVLGRKIRELVLPALQMAVDVALRFSSWARENSALIKAAFIGIAVGMLAIATATTAAGIAAIMANPPMMALAASVIAATWPILAIGAAVAALVGGIAYLVIKFKEWQGEGSKTETMLGKIFAVIQGLWTSLKNNVLDAFEVVWTYIHYYIAVLGDEFNLLMALINGDPEEAAEAWKKLTQDIEDMFTVLYRQLRWMWRNFVDDLKGGNAGVPLPTTKSGRSITSALLPGAGIAYGILDSFNMLRKGASWLGGANRDEGGAPQSGLNWLNAAPAAPGATSNSTSSSVENHFSGDILINTQSTDARGIFKEFSHWVLQTDKATR